MTSNLISLMIEAYIDLQQSDRNLGLQNLKHDSRYKSYLLDFLQIYCNHVVSKSSLKRQQLYKYITTELDFLVSIDRSAFINLVLSGFKSDISRLISNHCDNKQVQLDLLNLLSNQEVTADMVKHKLELQAELDYDNVT